MFDDVDDAGLAVAMADHARAEAVAAGNRLAVVAELVTRRIVEPGKRERWACDHWDAVAAEVAAAQGISHGLASSQMYLAVALRDRLPRVGALLREGAISARLASAMVWHTGLVTDPGVLALIDADLAEAARGLGGLSVGKAADAIDVLVESHDPVALRRSRYSARGRDVVVDVEHNESGVSTVWGRLFSTDAVVLDRRLTQMAAGVCEADPRTVAQRRADALGALAAGATRLACGCGREDCSAGGDDERATNVVIHVVAEAQSLTEAPDALLHGLDPDPGPPGEALMREPDPEPDPRPPRAPAVIVGGGIVPASMLAELVAGGAKTAPLWYPGSMAPEPGYRPSKALADFVRCRDLTCRWPNCDHPAVSCDIDHAIAYPLGPTHPANLRCLCRKHHLLKTFWTGPDGWSDRQYPDGTIVFTAPTGHTYTTRPGSRLLFPTLCLPTGPPPAGLPAGPAPAGDRDVMMPVRRRTRAQDRAQRIAAERALNLAELNEAPPP